MRWEGRLHSRLHNQPALPAPEVATTLLDWTRQALSDRFNRLLKSHPIQDFQACPIPWALSQWHCTSLDQHTMHFAQCKVCTMHVFGETISSQKSKYCSAGSESFRIAMSQQNHLCCFQFCKLCPQLSYLVFSQFYQVIADDLGQ